ncbi:hypothetical protein [Urbifossiella limnaea]|uniref:Lipoprotein n=1 Tax=Urbifossiella limnaea TaxID=2528023 RepID=A0A517XNI5_9BACT|nr:hypothetical protein [Urbifossiella limnaea]QDU19075.1 hypothetical protein ETAA1_09780 [Urbifossiella limnaea]
MRGFRFLLGAMVLAAGAGCTARQLARDTDQFRVAVCDLYTEQAIDNLIRARTYQVYVHLGYRDILAQTTDDVAGTLGASTGLSRDTGPVEGIMRTVTSGFVAGGSSGRQRQLSFHADPVVDRPDVYELYAAFAHDPGLFVESYDPPRCPVHVHRKRDHKHYWVPCEAGPAFQALVMRTAFQPAPAAAQSPAYDVKVEQVVEVRVVGPDDKSGRAGLATVVLKVSPPVPNGDGTLLLDIPGGTTLRAEVLPLTPGLPGAGELGKAVGVSTEYVLVQYRPAVAGIEPGRLAGLGGRVFSFQWPKVTAPGGPTASEKLQSDVERIRAGSGARPGLRR